jgi:hypothetical protein
MKMMLKITTWQWVIKSTLCIFQRKNTDPVKEQLTLLHYGMTKGNKRFGNICEYINTQILVHILRVFMHMIPLIQKHGLSI